MSAAGPHAWRDECFAAAHAHTAAQWRQQLRYADAMGWLTAAQANTAEEEIMTDGRVWSAAVAQESEAEATRAAEQAIWTATYNGGLSARPVVGEPR